MSVGFLSFVISHHLSRSQVLFRVYFVMVSVCICFHVWMCEHALVCMWFNWDLRKHCWELQRNLQQCHVSLSFSDSLLCYLQVVCVQLQMAYICLNLLCLSSFPWLARSFLLFLYKVFVFSQREWSTHHSRGGGKTEVPTCPVGKGGFKGAKSGPSGKRWHELTLGI